MQCDDGPWDCEISDAYCEMGSTTCEIGSRGCEMEVFPARRVFEGAKGMLCCMRTVPGGARWNCFLHDEFHELHVRSRSLHGRFWELRDRFRELHD